MYTFSSLLTLLFVAAAILFSYQVWCWPKFSSRILAYGLSAVLPLVCLGLAIVSAKQDIGVEFAVTTVLLLTSVIAWCVVCYQSWRVVKVNKRFSDKPLPWFKWSLPSLKISLRNLVAVTALIVVCTAGGTSFSFLLIAALPWGLADKLIFGAFVFLLSWSALCVWLLADAKKYRPVAAVGTLCSILLLMHFYEF